MAFRSPGAGRPSAFGLFNRNDTWPALLHEHLLASDSGLAEPAFCANRPAGGWSPPGELVAHLEIGPG